MRRRSAAATEITGSNVQPLPGQVAMFNGESPKAPAPKHSNVATATCSACGLVQTLDNAKNGENVFCGKCNEPLGVFYEANAFMPANVAKAASTMGTEVDSIPRCGTCQTKLTKTAVGIFYPCGHDTRKSATEPVLPTQPQPEVAQTEVLKQHYPDNRVGEIPKESHVHRDKELFAQTTVPASDVGEEVTVTYGEQVFSPVQYNSFRVGPMTTTTRVRPGETRADAARRAFDELSAAVEVQRQKVQADFLRSLAAVKGGRG